MCVPVWRWRHPRSVTLAARNSPSPIGPAVAVLLSGAAGRFDFSEPGKVLSLKNATARLGLAWASRTGARQR